MSLLKTKPKWCPFAEASEQGWINGNTGELLVSLRGLKSKLEAEQPLTIVIKEETVEIKETEVKVEAQPFQVKEQTVKKPKRNQKIIAEVVEYKIGDDQEVIGE